MAFTFQINRDVKFNHNEGLLEKSEKNRPEIFKTKVVPKRIVELVKDEKKLNGWGVKEADLSPVDLSSFGMLETIRLSWILANIVWEDFL